MKRQKSLFTFGTLFWIYFPPPSLGCNVLCGPPLTKELRPYTRKIKWCVKIKNHPLCNIDMGIGYDSKELQVLILVLYSKYSGHQQLFDFESKPTFIAQLCTPVHSVPSMMMKWDTLSGRGCVWPPKGSSDSSTHQTHDREREVPSESIMPIWTTTTATMNKSPNHYLICRSLRLKFYFGGNLYLRFLSESRPP